jgi:hypothetical protein
VFFAVASGVALFCLAVVLAKASYRTAHQLAPVETGFWIFSNSSPAPVSFAQLGTKTILIFAALAAAYALVLHPIVGRVVQAVAELLTRQVVSVYRLDPDLSKWDPDTSILFGSGWPITVISIPLLVIALLAGLAYRAVWQWH